MLPLVKVSKCPNAAMLCLVYSTFFFEWLYSSTLRVIVEPMLIQQRWLEYLATQSSALPQVYCIYHFIVI